MELQSRPNESKLYEKLLKGHTLENRDLKSL